MKNRTLTVAAVALGVASAASADFLGWSAQVYQSGNYYVMNVYAAANSASDAVLNVFNLKVTTNVAGGFYQAADNPFWAPSANQCMDTSLDSWITLGTKSDNTAHEGTVADANTVNFDDTYGYTDYSILAHNGNGAGWGVGNPNELVNVAKVLTQDHQGVQAGYGVLIGHFVLLASSVDIGSSFVRIEGGAVYNEGQMGQDDREFGFFIPGPGALALLAASGLVSRRRRA
jgi:hypothetical protein